MKISPEGLTVVASVRKSFVDALNALSVAVNETPDVDVAAQLAFVGDGLALFEKVLIGIEKSATESQLPPPSRTCAVPGCKNSAFVWRCVEHVLDGTIPGDDPKALVAAAEEPPFDGTEDDDTRERSAFGASEATAIVLPFETPPSSTPPGTDSASETTAPTEQPSPTSDSGTASTATEAAAPVATDGLCGAEFVPGKFCTLDKNHREVCEGEPHRPACLCKRCNAARGLVEVAS